MARIPSRTEVADWLTQNPDMTGLRDIAKAFGIKGPDKVHLKAVLKDLEGEGRYNRRKPRTHDKGKLPPVAVLTVTGPDASGDLFARPAEGEEARILVTSRKDDPALGQGDRILARLTPVAGRGHAYEARLIRKIDSGAPRVLGIFRAGSDGGRIQPVTKGADKEWIVAAGATAGARDGELVEAEASGPRRLGLPRARIVARLGDPGAPRAVSLIAIHEHGIPDHFPDAVLAEAEAERNVGLEGREDLRKVPFLTIDPADARDRDDAVWAGPDDDPTNPGGHLIWVAIADVAHFVTPGSALDREAWTRGNSTYFPDRVVPMLPDKLSGNLCSLHEDVDRAVLAVRIVIDEGGRKRGHRFARALIRSKAALNYEEVQAAHDGQPNARTEPLLKTGIAPLYDAFHALDRARSERQPLDLDLPERRIVLADDGSVVDVRFKERLDAHRLIEEFMILANVAAAEELIRLRRPLLFRVHEEPPPDKIDSLREIAEAAGYTLAKGQVLKTASLNRLLAQAEGSEHDEMLNIAMLRSMTQAYYSPQNFGHFGLALANYAHFTSPIRRYSDLIVHRGLISGHGWGPDGLSQGDIARLEETAKHISDTERRSMAAERDTTDRYLADYLNEHVGADFSGRISGVAKFGLFVKLDETGADGLVPIRTLGREYFHYDPDNQTLVGSDTGTTLTLGQKVTVRLAEAVPVTGGLVLQLLSVDEQALPGPKKGPRGAPVRRRPGQEAAKRRSVSRKRK